jgi:hypothetical protein
LAQTVAKKNISKRPWRVIVNAMAYIRREYNTESTLGVVGKKHGEPQFFSCTILLMTYTDNKQNIKKLCDASFLKNAKMPFSSIHFFHITEFFYFWYIERLLQYNAVCKILT